jgi:hypothetical protein
VAGVPATPTGVAGNTQVTVSVTAGSGGTPTSYTITKSTDGATYSTGCTVTVPASSCIVTGLTNGTAYTFKTTATNSAGTSGLSSASSSVTPVATCATGGTCVVGNTGPGGGFVFYVHAGGTFTSTGSDCNTACKYFEPATSDQSTNIAWATTAAFCYALNSTTGDQNCQSNSIYSGTGQTASRTTSEALGMGMANTNQIYARVSNNGGAGGAATSTYAAGLAWAYSVAGNSNTDWHLPSKAELVQLCNWNRGGTASVAGATLCVGTTLNSATNGANTSGFSAMYYWNSSELALNTASVESFDSGSHSLSTKSGGYYVRAVRAFG